MAEKIYRFSVTGNSGSLESLFVATDEQIAWILGKQIWFGDVLGKHSAVSFTMQPENFTVVTEELASVVRFKNTVEVSGKCPFKYLEKEQSEEYSALFPLVEEN